MSFQSTVNVFPALGVPGSLYVDGPIRSAPWNLFSNNTTPSNNIGYAFTVVNGASPDPAANSSVAGTAQVGGTGVFAGILMDPKEYASTGTAAGGPLAATLALPDYTIGQLLVMGEIIVSLNNAANVGDKVMFNNTTGALYSTTPTITLAVTTAGVTLTALTISQGSINTGSQITLASGEIVYVTGYGSGTGAAGTYAINPGVTLAATTAATTPAVAPAGYTFIERCTVDRIDVATSGLAAIKLTQ